MAAWISAALNGLSHPEVAEGMLQTNDEPHRVADLDALNWEHRVGLLQHSPAPLDSATETQSIAALLQVLREIRQCEVIACLPRPGDTGFLPGPPALNRAALEAEECVIIAEAGRAVAALVPQIQSFGSLGDHGHHVTWQVFSAKPRPIPPAGSIRAAHHALQSALLGHLDDLEALDVPAIARGDEIEIDHPVTWVRAQLPPQSARHLEVFTLGLRLSLVTAHVLSGSRSLHSAAASATQDGALSKIHRAGLDALVASLRAAD